MKPRAGSNNIGVLRLLLASLVIVGHSPELLDGNRDREPLTRLLHSLSLGELSVDCFFLLSGFLVAGSMLNLGSARAYLAHRALRIYPAFVVAHLLSVFVLAPVTGGDPWFNLGGTIGRLLALQTPQDYPGQLAGVRFYPLLNGAMWTIAYEFRCYLLVLALWSSGMLRSRRIILGLTMLSLIGLVVTTFHPDALRLRGEWMLFTIGDPSAALRFLALFLVGVCARICRDDVLPRITGRVAAVCAMLCVLGMYRDPHLGEACFASFGGVVLLWIAFAARLGSVQRINDSWDISYGVYLYGWPIATYLRWRYADLSPLVLALATLPLSFIAGAASWCLVERPVRERLRAAS